MLLDQIMPFVRFTAEQNMINCWINDGKEIVGYDHRIYFVLSGSGNIEIGGKRYPLQPNSFLMWRAGVPYAFHAEAGESLICITCNFDFTMTLRRSVPLFRLAASKILNGKKSPKTGCNFPITAPLTKRFSCPWRRGFEARCATCPKRI